MIGVAAIFGTFAATHTVKLGRSAQQPAVPSAQIAARNRALDRTEASLRRMLAQNPAAASGAAPVTPQRVVYVRPAPHIVTIHRNGGEYEAESARDGHDGGGFDD
jgi:hypothetical protein